MVKFKYLLLIIVLIASNSGVKGQIDVGLIGGINLTNQNFLMYYSENHNPLNYTGLVVGGLLNYNSKNFLSLRIELVYIEKGTNETIINFVQLENRFTYLEMPILFKYNIFNSKVKPYILAGPYIAYLLSAEYRLGDLASGIIENVKDMDLGLDFGAGISLPLSQTILNFEVRYALGLVSLYPGPDFNDTNRSLKILLGITFPL